MKIGADFNSNHFTKEQAFDRFISKKESFNLSKKTIEGYTSGWLNFLKFEEYSKRYLTFKDINEDLLTEYRLFLMKHTNANEVTRAAYIKNLRTVLYDFMNDDLLKKFQVIVPKFSTPIQETYSIEELNNLLQKPSMKKGKFNFTEYRT